MFFSDKTLKRNSDHFRIKRQFQQNKYWKQDPYIDLEDLSFSLLFRLNPKTQIRQDPRSYKRNGDTLFFFFWFCYLFLGGGLVFGFVFQKQKTNKQTTTTKKPKT